MRAAGATTSDLYGKHNPLYNGTAIEGFLATNGQPGVHETLLQVCAPT